MANVLSSSESSACQEASAMPKNNNPNFTDSLYGSNDRSLTEGNASCRETTEQLKEPFTNSASMTAAPDNDVKLMQNIRNCSVCDFKTADQLKLIEHLSNHCMESKLNQSNVNLSENDAQLLPLQGENSCDASSQSECSSNMMNAQEQSGESDSHTPRANTQGKVKTFRCKHCDFITVTKEKFWEHSRLHIKVEKLLTCPNCPFVTEHKHHLQYHMRNHTGCKPFKCDKCEYSCVNKSMLNSHKKSHSNMYQYSCANCKYVTKYCHSLKLHLRKHTHSPAMVLNADGTPNSWPIIDVYGNKRGPKPKSTKSSSPTSSVNKATPSISAAADQDNDSNNNGSNTEASQIVPSQQSQSLTCQVVTPAANGTNKSNEGDQSTNQNQTESAHDQVDAFNMSNQRSLPEDAECSVKTPSTSPTVRPPAAPEVASTNSNVRMSQELIERTEEAFDYSTGARPSESGPDSNSSISRTQPLSIQEEELGDEPLDLSKSNISQENLERSMICSSRTASTSRWRKGVAISLEHRLIINHMGKEMAPNENNFELSPASSFDFRVNSASESTNEFTTDSWFDGYVCHYCEISFRNEGMYTVHMGYHGFQEPYTCNLCGHKCTDRMSFYLHINRRTGHM